MTVYQTYGELDNIQMMPDEIDYMVERVRALEPGSLMVEWGAGGSSAKWLETMTPDMRLISIEHNAEWFSKVLSLKSTFTDKDFCPLYVDVSSEHFTHGYGGVEEETPFNVAEYIFPSPEIYNANIYFIDGIARGACLAGVLLNMKQPAEIYIHDYAPRTMAYEWVTQFCDVEIVATTLAKISPRK